MAFTTGTATFTSGSRNVTNVTLATGRLSYFNRGTRVVVGQDPTLAIVEAVRAPTNDTITLALDWGLPSGTYQFTAYMTSEGVNTLAETQQAAIDALAEASATIALIGSVFSSIQDGLDETNNGEFFSVSDDSDPLVFATRYRNDNGVATFVSQLLTGQAVIDARDAAEGFRNLSEAWATGTEPDGANTKSSREWSIDSEGFSDLAQLWAEGEEPAGAGTDSAKGWAETAEGYAGDSFDSAALSFRWANEAEDVVVSGGDFSAFHWSKKSEGFADNSATSAGQADTSAGQASSSASAAATSEQNASLSETNAATSEQNAATSETNAGNSATQAANSASAAATSEQNAALSETNAGTSETQASNSADAAALSETNAATSEANALSSEQAAATSEANALTSEQNAATSEQNAATSETNAATSANESNAARVLAEEYRDDAEDFSEIAAAYANFKGRWVDLTGALIVPSSVFHNGGYWQLMVDIADVTQSEPSETNTDWEPLSDELSVNWVDIQNKPDSDGIPEGANNLYFTNQRAIDAIKADADWNAADWDAAFGWGDHAQAGYALSSSLATVATSGDYEDLINKPDLTVYAEKTITDGLQQQIDTVRVLALAGI